MEIELSSTKVFRKTDRKWPPSCPRRYSCSRVFPWCGPNYEWCSAWVVKKHVDSQSFPNFIRNTLQEPHAPHWTRIGRFDFLCEQFNDSSQGSSFISATYICMAAVSDTATRCLRGSSTAAHAHTALDHTATIISGVRTHESRHGGTCSWWPDGRGGYYTRRRCASAVPRPS